MNVCDESKCVSTGLSAGNNNTFTCYGDDGEYFPMMCADGYEPRVVESMPSVPGEGFPWWLFWKDESDVDAESITLRYFTCCPPESHSILSGQNETAAPRRHCSDPISFSPGDDSDDTTNMICNNSGRSYSRRMKTSRFLTSGMESENGMTTTVESYMCCDSPILHDESTTAKEAFLEEKECVPYHDDFYRHQLLRNEYGKLYAANCELQDFAVARPIHEGTIPHKSSNAIGFECCRTGPYFAFHTDSAFKLTVYPQLVLSTLAVVSSLVMIVALTIPLMVQFWQKRTSQQQEARRSSISGQSMLQFRQERTSQQQEARRSSISGPSLPSVATTVPYSPYNLYLIYLAIPDTIANAFQIALVGSYANQRCNTFFRSSQIAVYPYDLFVDTRNESTILMWYATCNMFLNAVVAREVLVLLEDSHNVRRHKSPSSRKVNFQAAAIFLFTFALNVGMWGIQKPKNEELTRELLQMTWSVYCAVNILPPLLYVAWVGVTVWRQGYLASAAGRSDFSQREKGLRQLAWYFCRVIAIFVVVWSPAIVLSLVMVYDQSTAGNVANGILILLLAIQPVLSNCVTMTKSDVRKYVVDLLTLSYIRRGKATIEKEREAPLLIALAASATSSVMVGTDVFSVRPFSSTRDQENLSEMCKNVWGGTDYLPNITRVYESDPSCEFLVMEDEATGEMAAAGNRRFIDETETSVWLEAIRVSTKVEGRGIATNLMKELCRRSRTDGAREILSCTIDSNTPMMRLFGKEGIDMKPIRTACFPDLGTLAKLPGWSASGITGEDVQSKNILKAMDLEHLIKDEPKLEQWEPIQSEEELKKILEVMEDHGRLGRIPAMGKLMWMSDDLKDSIEKGLVRRKVCKSDEDPPALFAFVKDRAIQSLRSQYVCSIIATGSHDFDAAVWEACKSEYVPLLDGIPSFCFIYELPFPSDAKSVIEYFPQQIENAFTYHRWIANNI